MEVSSALRGTESEMDAEVAEKLGVPLVICKLPQALCWRCRLVDGDNAASDLTPATFDLESAQTSSKRALQARLLKYSSLKSK